METEAIVAKLEELLEEERLLIRTLKGPEVERIAHAKLALMKELDLRRTDGFGSLTPRVKDLVRKIRNNSILLVHAKGIVTEAIRVKRAALAAASITTAGPVPVPAANRLSVRG